MVLRMELSERSYDILVERGALGRLGQYTNLNRKALVVTDDGVPPAYAQRVAEQFREGQVFTVPHGEGAKSFHMLEAICGRLLESRFTRSDLVVAVGGGVVGDLAGFAASCYMRGVGFINLPTTTLSQIDSSIGGKVAVNLNGIKNCVGAFYQPELVAVDSDTLNTLPERHFANGLVEAVKAGLLEDSGLFELFEAGDPHERIDEIILRSLAVKKVIVEQDEKEIGLRKLLNLGHTIGHGVESVCGLEDASGEGLLHGEAVAVGLLPMVDDPALRERVRAVLKGLSIDPDFPYDPDRVYERMTRDKKSHGGSITIARVRAPGEAYLKELTLEELRQYC